MGLKAKANTFTTGETILASEHNANFDDLYNEFNGNIENVNISGSAAIVDTKLAQITTAGKVLATAITGSYSDIVLTEGTAPTTAASEGGLFTKDIGGQPELVYVEESDGDEVQITNAGSVQTPTGGIVQVVNTTVTAVASGTTVMPLDDTIPQNTEGDEFMTLAITPVNTNNKLLIEVNAVMSLNASSDIVFALFQDSTAGALAAGCENDVTDDPTTCVLKHYMTAGTVSATTFKFRAGKKVAGTTVLNGAGAATRLFGGVAASSITITEIKV